MEEEARRLYFAVLRTANYFLHNCVHFSIEDLAEEDPSYEEVAEAMDIVGKIILALADDFDPMLCQQAFEYCLLMKKMGQAISNRDENALSGLVEELERKPFI